VHQADQRPNRFYETVSVEREKEGYALRLDGKPVRTPLKNLLVLPTRALAQAVAEEWRAQGVRIDPETMPLTKLANSVIDGVHGNEEAVIDDIVAHAASDLLCYRADGPHGLVAAQEAEWNPVLDWVKDTLDAPLTRAEGVTHATQPQASLDRIKERLQGLDAFSLAALHVMTGLTGSALLALAVALGRLIAEGAWKAAHVDEDWQIGKWGEDDEAAARRAHRRRDFDAAARLLQLVR
jgi:chaperone required for assembly of F1-ATPase